MPMKLSPSGKDLIKGFEGLSLVPYKDASGVSVGYGHFIVGSEGHSPSDYSAITRAQADAYFDQDIAKFEDFVATYVGPRTSQAQFDAMVSLTYNIGTGGFQSSTVLRKHINDDYQGAADAFLMWTKSQGKELPVLKARRQKEREYYLFGAGSPPPTFGAGPLAPAFGTQAPGPKPQALAESSGGGFDWPPSSTTAIGGTALFIGLLVAGGAFWLLRR